MALYMYDDVFRVNKKTITVARLACKIILLPFQACPIILASAKGHIKCVKVLLNHQDVDVSMTNTVGYNCLAEAIRNGHK